MANISQAQAKLLNTNFLDSLAKDDSFTANLDNLPLTQRLLIEAAAVFVQNARDNVQKPKNGRSLISTGALQDSIFASELRVDGNNLEIDLGYRGKGGKYADFVNEGVKGIESQDRAPQSPYSFKAANGLTPGPSMRKALEQWIKKNRAKIRNTPANVNYKKSRGGGVAGAAATQSKRRALSQGQDVKSLAYAIGTNIRKKGLRRSGFFDDAIRDTFNQTFYDAVASVVGADMSIGIRKLNNLSTK
jgi:hypothetical protein